MVAARTAEDVVAVTPEVAGTVVVIRVAVGTPMGADTAADFPKAGHTAMEGGSPTSLGRTTAPTGAGRARPTRAVTTRTMGLLAHHMMGYDGHVSLEHHIYDEFPTIGAFNNAVQATRDILSGQVPNFGGQ